MFMVTGAPIIQYGSFMRVTSDCGKRNMGAALIPLQSSRGRSSGIS
jgi:hypothetical protein